MQRNALQVTGTEIQKTPLIFQHIERYLGTVNGSWMETLEGEKCPFQVVRCSGRVLHTTFFCTLGLASHPLRCQPRLDAALVRQELLMAIPRTFGTRNVPPLLQQLGAIALHRRRPFVHGEIIRGSNPVFVEWPFRGFYASHPCVIAQDEFAECVREDGERVSFIWMVPVYQSEIDFVREYGSSRLEDLFVEKQLDLVMLNRQPAVD